jgi:outer membrane protein TolC
MVKRLLIAGVIIAQAGALCHAQSTVDYNKIIVPGSGANLNAEERLVQIAWRNYPENEALWHELQAAEAEVRIQRWSWLNQIYAQGNLNEFTIDPDKGGGTANFWPRYNVGVNIPLGKFVSIPNETRKAKEAYRVKELNINKQKLYIRATILGLYTQYTSLLEIYKIEKSASDDADGVFRIDEQKFKNGETTLEKYNTAQDYRNAKKLKEIMAENDMKQIKYKLEELLGMRLEEALN